MVHLCFFIISALFSGALTLGVLSLHPLWALPIFLGAYLACNLIYVIYLVLSALLFSKEPPARPSRFALFSIRLALPWVTTLLRLPVKVSGREKLPDEKHIYVCNHRSAMDPVYLMTAFPRRTAAFVSKSSVRKYPIVGGYMNAAGFVFIDRDSPMQSLRCIHRAAKYVKEERDLNYGIFPEGTRSRDGSLLPFKSGAFVLAKKSDTPIAVFTMTGSESAFRHFPFHRPRIRITVAGIIPVEDVRALSVDELSDRARAIMLASLAVDTKTN